MGLGGLNLLLVELRLARDLRNSTQQNGMNNDFAVCRTGELIDNQAHALPHRLNLPRPAPCRAGSARFVSRMQQQERGR